MNTLIVADVHLKGTTDGEETMRQFVRFLRAINPAEFSRVIILGDLFDFWFEYRHVIFSEYFEVLRALAELRDAGVERHLICGNHDFWAGTFMRDRLGIAVHHAPYACTMGGRNVLFVHGDGVNPRDIGYRVYKRFARYPPVIALFRLLHPDWAMALARFVSRGSRSLRTAKDRSTSSEVRAMEAYAARILERGEADVVVCGHTHYAVQRTIGNGLYINTGDWMDNRHYLVWDGQRFEPRVYRETVSIAPAPLQAEQTTRAGAVPKEIPAHESAEPR